LSWSRFDLELEEAHPDRGFSGLLTGLNDQNETERWKLFLFVRDEARVDWRDVISSMWDFKEVMVVVSWACRKVMLLL
jgi:hypothetical protein